MTTRILALILLAAAGFYGCKSRALGHQNQGLTGQITEVRGNQMPSPDQPAAKGFGVSREIFIYTATTQAQVIGTAPLFDAIKSKLIASTRSNASGKYSVFLPPGKYSVFIKVDGRYFAAQTDGMGTLNPVEVRQNMLTVSNVLINNAAVY